MSDIITSKGQHTPEFQAWLDSQITAMAAIVDSLEAWIIERNLDAPETMLAVLEAREMFGVVFDSLIIKLNMMERKHPEDTK